MIPGSPSERSAPAGAVLPAEACAAALLSVLAGLRERGSVATFGWRRRAVLYRRADGWIGSVAILPFATSRGSTSPPVIIRTFVDYPTALLTARAARELGINGFHVVPHAPGSLELFCTPRELAPLAAWLPAWTHARDAGMTAPSPPVTLARTGLARPNVWTTAAYVAIVAWERLDRERQVRPAARCSGAAE